MSRLCCSPVLIHVWSSTPFTWASTASLWVWAQRLVLLSLHEQGIWEGNSFSALRSMSATEPSLHFLLQLLSHHCYFMPTVTSWLTHGYFCFFLSRTSVSCCQHELGGWELIWPLLILLLSLTRTGTPKMTFRLRPELTGLDKRSR